MRRHEFRHIVIAERQPDTPRKTLVFSVSSKDGGLLGFISWYGPWRKYTFSPEACTVFEQDCLRDLAGFIQSETERYKRDRKASHFTEDSHACVETKG